MRNHSACPGCSLGILPKRFSSRRGLIWLAEMLDIPLPCLSRENPQGWAPKASSSPTLGDAIFGISELAKSFGVGLCGEGFAVPGSVRGRISCARSHPQGMQSGATVPREPPGAEAVAGSSHLFRAVAVPLIPEECPRHFSCWPGDPRDLFIES